MKIATLLLVLLTLLGSNLFGHDFLPIVPTTRSITGRTQAVTVTKVDAQIKIVDRLAVTQLDIHFQNPTRRLLESTLVLPVPDGSVLRAYTFAGKKPEATAKILPKKEARELYDSIVAKTRDPALLEFVGTGLIQSSVFPVPANGTQRVQLVWEQLLPIDGDRIDYILPRSATLEYNIPWTFNIETKATGTGPATLYSPSHELTVKNKRKGVVHAHTNVQSDPGPFQLSLLRSRKNTPTASFIAYPDPKVGGGYFLMLAAPSAKDEKAPELKREVTIVLDRSGSMRGKKLEQVKEATLQIIEGLADGEAFNLIVYNESVELFSEQPVIKDDKTMQEARDYIKNLRVSGGTNIHDAMVEALRQKPANKDFIPLVLFLTDGLPTIGQTSEKSIREVAEKGNPHKRRIFTFGVGLDVNTPLLNRIARDSRAIATYVLPDEDVEVKVGSVYRKLSAPLLAAPKISAPRGRFTELLPSELPDLFEGGQIVLLGQYQGDKPVQIKLSGRAASGPVDHSFTFKLNKASTKNAWVSRLWASNKIGILSEAIHNLNAEPNSADPKIKELVGEIINLSREFGILTEYTAFFAREGTDFSQTNTIFSQTNGMVMERTQVRSGVSSYNQTANYKRQVESKSVNPRNKMWGADLQEQEYDTVQQVGNGSFYKRNNQWHSNAVVLTKTTTPDRVVEIGTPEFSKLVDQLVVEGRQSAIALRGEILIKVDQDLVLIR